MVGPMMTMGGPIPMGRGRIPAMMGQCDHYIRQIYSTRHVSTDTPYESP